MDRRAFATGISVGQFVAKRDMSKNDVQNFFSRYKDNCDECPFAENCAALSERAQNTMTLCDVIEL